MIVQHGIGRLPGPRQHYAAQRDTGSFDFDTQSARALDQRNGDALGGEARGSRRQ